MDRMFEEYALGSAKMPNRFVFPPVKLGYGNPDGTVTDRQLTFYRQIARRGPAVVILEPVAVTADGREHPKQPCIHLDRSKAEMKKIADVVHAEKRLACLHLNHAGAAANPKVTGAPPRAPSAVVCTAREGRQAVPLEEEEIEAILAGYRSAAEKASAAGFDMIEVQAGHGYLLSQFLSGSLNRRTDRFGSDRLLFAREAVSRAMKGAPGLPFLLRISGDEMAPEFGVSGEELILLLEFAESAGIAAVHVGMGSACFSPPWYFHHGSLPEGPQNDALSWIREQTYLPIIAAGRMGRRKRIEQILDGGLADMVALGRPLIADPDLIAKWQAQEDDSVRHCGYCLQGCLHRLKSGQPLGCNVNPEIGLPPLAAAEHPLSVLVAGGGPAGMSAALYLSRKGHDVTLAEQSDRIGGQFALAWKAPGKAQMKDALDAMGHILKKSSVSLSLGTTVDADVVREMRPDLLVWAAGAVAKIPEIAGAESQHTITADAVFNGASAVTGPRVLIIGAGRTGLEAAEKLGKEGFEVVATKRTDPIGSMMEQITRKLLLMRLDKMTNVTLMPHTTIKAFSPDKVEVEQDGNRKFLDPFQTVVIASGMVPAAGPDKDVAGAVRNVEIIGDAKEVSDIFNATHAGYELAQRY